MLILSKINKYSGYEIILYITIVNSKSLKIIFFTFTIIYISFSIIVAGGVSFMDLVI